MSVDPDTFKAVLSAVPTSVAVVTAVDADDGALCGLTIGSLTSLSLLPPLVLFCVDMKARSHPTLRRARRYCVSVLAQHQAEVARRFVQRDPRRFRLETFDLSGLPAVAGATAWLLCSRHRLVPAGDHTIVIAQVEHAVNGAGPPLLYHDRSYRELAPVADDARLSMSGIEVACAG